MVCCDLQNPTEIFAATTGGAEAMASEMLVPFLGRVPLDPRLGMKSLSLWTEFSVLAFLVERLSLSKKQSNLIFVFYST